MRSLKFLLVSSLLSLIGLVSSRSGYSSTNPDSILTLKPDPKGNFYVTLSNSGTRLERWQTYTGRILNDYDTEGRRVVDFFIDINKKVLIGLFQDNITIWNIQSGEKKSSLPWPADVARMLQANWHVLKDDKIAAYDPLGNNICVSSGSHILVINCFTGQVMYSDYAKYMVEQPHFINQGKTLVAVETVSNEVFSLDLTSKKRKFLHKGTMFPRITVRETGDRLMVVDMQNWKIYNEREELIKEGSVKFFFSNAPRFLGSTEMVFQGEAGPYLRFFFPQDNSEGSFANEFDIAEFDTYGTNLIFWNNTSVGIKSFTGDPYFITENYTAGRKKADFFVATSDSLLKSSTGKIMRHQAPVTTYDQLGDLIASGDLRGNLYVWKSSGELITTSTLLSDAITAIKFDDKNLVVGASAGRAAQYDITAKKVAQVFRGLSYPISAVGYSDDHKLFITCDRSKKVTIWDNLKGTLVVSLPVSKIPLSARLSSSYTLEVFLEGNEIVQIDASREINHYMNAPRTVLVNTSHAAKLNSLSFSPDGTRLLSCDEAGTIKVWDVQNLVAINTFTNGPHSNEAVFTYDGKQILSHSMSELYLNDARTGTQLSKAEFPAVYSGSSFHVVTPLDNNVGALMLLTDNKNQMFYNINTNRISYLSFSEHSYPPFGVAIHPNNQEFATLSSDGIDFTGFENLKKSREIHYPNKSHFNAYAVRNIQYNPDGTLIAAECDNKIVIWNTQTLAELIQIPSVNEFCFTENHRIVYFKYDKVSNDYKVICQDVNTGLEIFNSPFHSDHEFYKISYDSVHSLIALGSYRGQITLLDARTGQLIKSTRSSINSKVEGGFDPVTGELAFAVPGGIKLFDLNRAREKKYIDLRGGKKGGYSSTPSLQYTPDGKYLLTTRNSKTQLLDRENLELQAEFTETYNIQFSPDHKLIAMQDTYGADISVYSIKTGEKKYFIEGDEKAGSIDSYIFSPESDGIFYILRKFKTQAEISSQGKFEKRTHDFFVGYDFSKQKNEQEVPITTQAASDLDISSDGKLIAFQSDYRKIMLMNLAGGAPQYIEHDRSFEFFKFMPDSKSIIIGENNGRLSIYDLDSKKLKSELISHTAMVRRISFFQDRMASFSEDGTAVVWDARTWQKQIQLSAFASEDYIFIGNQNYYSGTKGISNAVFFKEGNSVFPFDQFDLVYNRPDLVVKDLGASREYVDAYREAYLKRIHNLGFNENLLTTDGSSLPVVKFSSTSADLRTSKSSLDLTIEGADSKFALDRLNIWVNDVPLNGMKGLSLAKQNSRNHKTTISIPLSAGLNKIQVSYHNVKGMESIRKTKEITYTPETKAKPDLYLLAISVSDYLDDAYDLKFARKDGSDLVHLFGNGEDFANIYIDTLFDQAATLKNVTALKSRLMNTHVDDQVILFISGHGLLDKKYDFYFASYDMDFSNPALRGIPYTTIEGLLDGIPARKKLLLIDACHSGEVDKEGFTKINTGKNTNRVPGWANRGGVAEVEVQGKLGLSGSFELMQELFANLNRGSGAVVISAAAGDEYALEMSNLRNGVFTYCIKDGLTIEKGARKADANRNGFVSVSELKEFVSTQVESLTGGRQKPTSRRENLEMDFVVQ